MESPLPGLAIFLHFTQFSTEMDSDLLFVFSDTRLRDEDLLGVYSGQDPVQDIVSTTGTSRSLTGPGLGCHCQSVAVGPRLCPCGPLVLARSPSPSPPPTHPGMGALGWV